MSDDTARRLAWAAFGIVMAGYLAAVLTGFMPDRRTDPDAAWGWHESTGDAVFGTIMLVFPVVGVTIARQQPKNRIGWLLLAIGFAWMGTGFNDLYVRYGALYDPGSLPRPDVVAVLAEGSWVFAVGLLGTFLILLFPDGRLPSRRWRAVGWLSGISIAVIYLLIMVSPGRTTESDIPFRNPFGIQALKPLGEAAFLPILSLPVSIVACAVALVMRYRRSSGVERLQLKWLATSGAFFAATYLFAMLHGALSAFDIWGGGGDGWSALLDASFAVWFALIPVSIGFAVLKHRLYEIDVVINKALVFGTLAAFITAMYIGIVVGVGAALGQGDRPNIALSIVATALVAIAFQPVRERVQRFANRLVYGARATPYEVMSNFAARMGGAYGATDLLPRMARTIAEGVGATRVEVWLRIGSAFVRETSWPAAADEPGEVPQRGTDVPDLPGDRVVPVRHQGELLGVVTVTKAPGETLTPAEDKLLGDVAAQAGLVLRNVRLIEELRSSRQRLVSTQDDERRRLERNLHDGAQQSLVTVALILRMAKGRLGPDSAAIAPSLDQASELLATAIEELRELARGIHPAILTERGLGPALASLAERSVVPVRLAYELESRPAAAVEATVYFVVMEALANVAKYAEASLVDIRVERQDDDLVVTIADDGIGGADAAKGSGLRGLADRVAVVDGELDVESAAGGGTRLGCRIPLEPRPTPGLESASSLRREPVAVGGGER